MDIRLREYQQATFDNIVTELQKGVKRVAVAMPTGGGKSVVIGKLANELNGRTLILTHRIEILSQNEEWLKDAGVLSSKVNTVMSNSNIVIAMVQTAFARVEKYGVEYLGQFDNIILDEIQILIFEKVFDKYDYKRLIGFTATPVLMKKKYTTIDDIEYVEPYTLSEIFDSLVQGSDTQDLIDLGYLVQDFNIVLKLPDFDKLRESDSSPDGYTKQSLAEVYVNTASLEVLSNAYTKYCTGKKTIIFNASTEINKFVYKHFLEIGANVKMFDSVNAAEINPKTEKNYTRDEIIEWFNNERDAVLINTNVFTTGFNVPDVEVVIVNRATKSLSLWIQMVGRGSRITDKILKDSFTVLDLGQNVHEHGIWSMRRDWNNWFFSSGKKLKNKQDILRTWECKYCGALNILGEIKCEVCGKEKVAVISDGNDKKQKDGEFEVIGDIPLPKANSIIAYTLSKKETSNFAFRLLEAKIIDLFVHYQVDDTFYEENRDRFHARIKNIFRPVYFGIINSDLQGSNRRLETQFEKLTSKIDKRYGY